MTLRLSSLAAAIALFLASPIAILADDLLSPLGSWQASNGDSRYDVVECGPDAICAKLIWLREDVRTAENLALLDTYIAKGAKVRDNKWQGTAIHDGGQVDATMSMAGANVIRLTGCQFLCQTLTLRRISTEVAAR